MPYVLIKHNVARFEVFEAVFKDDEERRKRLGSLGGRLFRVVSDPNSLYALFEWDTVENAHKFADTYELREAIEWATDQTPPRVRVIEEIMETDA